MKLHYLTTLRGKINLLQTAYIYMCKKSTICQSYHADICIPYFVTSYQEYTLKTMWIHIPWKICSIQNLLVSSFIAFSPPVIFTYIYIYIFLTTMWKIVCCWSSIALAAQNESFKSGLLVAKDLLSFQFPITTTTQTSGV